MKISPNVWTQCTSVTPINLQSAKCGQERGVKPKAERRGRTLSYIAFRLGRIQKFRYGVPPFQKLPVWRSGAFRLSLSTAYSRIEIKIYIDPERWNKKN